MGKKYKVHHYDDFYKEGHLNHYRGTYHFDTLEEAERFAKDRNDTSNKYGFTSYYVVELP